MGGEQGSGTNQSKPLDLDILILVFARGLVGHESETAALIQEPQSSLGGISSEASLGLLHVFPTPEFPTKIRTDTNTCSIGSLQGARTSLPTSNMASQSISHRSLDHLSWRR